MWRRVLRLICIPLAVLLGCIEAVHALDVTLSWDPNSEPDLEGYKIYFSTSSGGPYDGTGSSSGSSPITVPLSSLIASNPEFTVRDLPDGTYYFVVTAYDAEGLESGYSNQVSASSSAIPNETSTISSFVVGGQSGASTVYTNSATRQISVRIVASDDAALSQYLVLDNQNDPTGKTFYSIPGAGQKTADFTISFALNDNDGNRTLYAWVKNAEGVISAAASKPNVVLDRAAPTVALSYSKPNAYKAGDAILLTANFSDSSPIAGIPRISIDFAGTGSDFSSANMTQASSNQWTYNLTIPSGNDGMAAVTVAAADAAGNTAGTPSGNTFTVDNTTPTVVGSPVFDNANFSVTISYSEGKMQHAASQTSYSFNNGLLLSGNATDVNGDARVFRLPLNASSFNKFMIYTLMIGSNVTDAAGNQLPAGGRSFQINDADNDGMADGWETQWFGSITAKNGTADTDKDGLTDKLEYSYSRQNPSWGWKLNPTDSDSDKDGMPDGFEAKNGLKPADASDKDLDSDNDGWTNLQEYQQGTNPNDPSTGPAAEAPQVKTVNGQKEVMPRETETAANDTGFAVLLESAAGIDITDSSAVTLTIEDGRNRYERRLLQENTTGYALVQAAPVSGSGSLANEVWVVYYRSAETSISKTWPFGSVVKVSVTAKDVNGNAMKEPEVFTFQVETANSHNERVAERPSSENYRDASGAKVVKNSETLATVTFTDTLPMAPYFDKEKVLDYPGAEAQTMAVTLGPHLVFPEGATVFIPWQKGRMVALGEIAIYGFDGEKWIPIIDANGNDLTDGSWVVPGWNNGLSWQSVVDGSQSGIKIKVRHFSSFVGARGASATDAGTPQSSSGAGCFITTLMQ